MQYLEWHHYKMCIKIWLIELKFCVYYAVTYFLYLLELFWFEHIIFVLFTACNFLN